MSREIPQRLQWFISRIGHRIYRNDDGCSCNVCKHIVEYGLVIKDRLQAEYCYDCECDFNADGTPLRYFDTKEEVSEWLKTIQK